MPLQPIIISILFQHYNELKECVEEVKQISGEEASLAYNNQGLMEEQEQEVRKEEEEEPFKIITIDSYFINDNNNL